jgi:hypothetical protein
VRASLPPTQIFVDTLVKALRDKDVLTTTVIGGSETAGVECDDGELSLKDCAWSARLAKQLTGLFPGKRFIVRNLASGGSTISVSLPLLGTWTSTTPDLLLVDYIVNDSFEGQRAWAANKEGGKTLIGLYEAFIHKLLELHMENRTAFVNTCTLARCEPTRAIISQAATMHDVAVLDYAGAANCAVAHGADPLSFWSEDVPGTKPHPNWHVHQIIADAIALKISQQTACDPGWGTWFSSQEELESLEFCDTPVTLITAFDPPSSGVTANQWELKEDRPNKPGWIASSDNASLEFDVVFGASSDKALVVSWLRSYKALGDAFMMLNGRTVRLPGLYGTQEAGNRVSQTFMHIFPAGEDTYQPELGLSGVLGFNVSADKPYKLAFRTAPETAVNGTSKFKIVSVSTC